jgi:hypothetical protein
VSTIGSRCTQLMRDAGVTQEDAVPPVGILGRFLFFPEGV